MPNLLPECALGSAGRAGRAGNVPVGWSEYPWMSLGGLRNAQEQPWEVLEAPIQTNPVPSFGAVPGRTKFAAGRALPIRDGAVRPGAHIRICDTRVTENLPTLTKLPPMTSDAIVDPITCVFAKRSREFGLQVRLPYCSSWRAATRPRAASLLVARGRRTPVRPPL
jgi:hypothetical protein